LNNFFSVILFPELRPPKISKERDFLSVLTFSKFFSFCFKKVDLAVCWFETRRKIFCTQKDIEKFKERRKALKARF